MPINYPIDCDSPRKRIEWLYCAQELLRLLHNAFGKWYRGSLTQEQYDKFPQKVKNKYSYKNKLSEIEWQQFLSEDFDPCSLKISNEICVQRELLKQSKTWDVKIEDI